jgi:hypothetical protein
MAPPNRRTALERRALERFANLPRDLRASFVMCSPGALAAMEWGMVAL